MKLSIDQIDIPYNYVLVLADKSFDRFQQDGEDTLATGSVNMENTAEHYSVRGKVFAVPKELSFRLEEMQANRVPQAFGMGMEEMAFYFRSYMMQNLYLKHSSVLYKTEMEVKVGNVVFFNYQEHYNCYQLGRWVDTVEHGEMLLIKYDELICTHSEDSPEELTMLNGLVLIEPVTPKIVNNNSHHRKGRIVVTDMKHENAKPKKKMSVGRVVCAGSPCEKYFEFPEREDGHQGLNQGEVVLYNAKLAPPLEFSLHRTQFDGREVVKLRRRDIFCTFPSGIDTDAIRELVLSAHLS